LQTAPSPEWRFQDTFLASPQASPRGQEIEQQVLAALPASGPYRILPLGNRGEWRIVLCEARIRESYPAFANRRRWVRQVTRRLGPVLAVVTDAAHSAFVWGWMDRSQGSARYVEFRIPERERSLSRAVAELDRKATTSQTPDWSGGGFEADIAAMDALIERLRARGLRCPRQPARLQCWIERLDTPTSLRRLWRSLTTVAFVDPDCRRGDALLGCAKILEALYVAVLDRMRCWVDDPAAGEWRRRNRLADFELLVERSEQREIHSSTEVFARRLIVQNNLFALARSPADARRCRERLHRYASLRPAVAGVDSNVLLRKSPAASTRGSRAESDLVPRAGIRDLRRSLGDDRSEVIETIAHVLQAARDGRIAGGAPLEELRGVALELSDRHARLLQGIDARWDGRLSDPTSSETPDDLPEVCRLWTFFPALLGRSEPVVLTTTR
jgi:hypothetical protein